MILFEASHTSHTHAQTGVQRVVRSLFGALSKRESVEPVCFDPHQSAWRALQDWEQAILNDTQGVGSAHRSTDWPLKVRLAGYARQIFNARSTCPAGIALVAPEIFSAKIARAYPALFARVRGPRVAVFHDAVALKLPEFTPAKTVARFPCYMRELLAFDGIAAVSEDSRQSLIDYWQWLGVRKTPQVVTITNAVEIQRQTEQSAVDKPSADATPVILSVGSLEGRKNHLALLNACEQLWAEGLRFELRLIGLAHPQTGKSALEKVRALQTTGRPVRYDGPVDDATLAAAYAGCTFTVYPSLMEGFGLPVQESLAHGKPCICSNRGALGEAAEGGGCLTLDQVDATSLGNAMRSWLSTPAQLAAATEALQGRRFKSWRDSADEFVLWLRTLRQRG
ncbi:MAG: glycosyltransferase family 4 protein [Verrucomicrobia bacterium]|nr:glycosyltransferase family 4 protein [Verrucomicrobiota bacterium]